MRIRTRNQWRRWLAGAILLTVLAALPAGGKSKPTRVKLATLAPRGSSFHEILLEMGEEWRAAPGGGVKLTIYPDGAMGGEADVVRKMRIGQIQAAMLTSVGLGEIDESVAAVQLMPMAFHNLDEVEFVLDGMLPTLEKRIEAKGFVVLFWGDAGWVRLFSKKPAQKPTDLKSMKLFTWAGDSGMLDLWRIAGWNPVPLETSDILPGFQTNMIDAIFALPIFALTSQLYNHAPNMLKINWAPLLGGAVMTRKAWDKIPAPAKDTLLESAREAGLQVRSRSRKEGDEAVEAMKKRGLSVHTVTPELEAEWQKAAAAAYPKIRGHIVEAALFDEVQRLITEARKKEEPVE